MPAARPSHNPVGLPSWIKLETLPGSVTVTARIHNGRRSVALGAVTFLLLLFASIVIGYPREYFNLLHEITLTDWDSLIGGFAFSMPLIAVVFLLSFATHAVLARLGLTKSEACLKFSAEHIDIDTPKLRRRIPLESEARFVAILSDEDRTWGVHLFYGVGEMDLFNLERAQDARSFAECCNWALDFVKHIE